MKVGDLVFYVFTGELSIVTWVNKNGAYFKVMDRPQNQICRIGDWEKVGDDDEST